MSEENHPNINAAGFVTEIIIGFRKYLRGNAIKDDAAQKRALEILDGAGLQDFVIKVSEKLDEEFGT